MPSRLGKCVVYSGRFAAQNFQLSKICRLCIQKLKLQKAVVEWRKKKTTMILKRSLKPFRNLLQSGSDFAIDGEEALHRDCVPSKRASSFMRRSVPALQFNSQAASRANSHSTCLERKSSVTLETSQCRVNHQKGEQASSRKLSINYPDIDCL